MITYIVREYPGRYARWEIIEHPSGRSIASHIRGRDAQAEADRLNQKRWEN